MAKKQLGLSAQGKRTVKNVKYIADKKLDYSDIPPSTDDELKKARRVGRPKTGNAKQLIAIRIEPKLLEEIRKLASKHDKPYQSFIHELLEKAAKKAA
jgi:predicted DNA binding CopG/RHH family protein